MDAGKVIAWDILEISCGFSASITRSGTYSGHSASCTIGTQWCPDWLTTLSGIQLECVTMVSALAADATGAGLVSLIIGDLGVYQFQAYTGGFQTSLSARFEMDDVALYVTQSDGIIIWLLTWSEMRFYAGGSLVWTGAGGSFASENVTPVGILLLGIPGQLAAGAAVNPLPVLGGSLTTLCAASSLVYNSSTTATGGVRFQEAGSGVWSSLPVTYSGEAIPSVTCDFTATTDEPTVTTTIDAEVTAYSGVNDTTVAGAPVTGCQTCSNGGGSGWEFTPWYRTLSYETRSAAITLLPDLAKSVERWGDSGDYSAIIGRYGFPSATRQATAQCYNYRTEADDVAVAETDMFPSYTEFLSRVENAAHTIEDPMGETSYAPYTYQAFKYRSRGTCVETSGVGICPTPAPDDPPATPPTFCGTIYDDAISHTVISSFVTETQDIVGTGANTAMNAALYHVDDLARYLNYCCHPHWSYEYWFPVNDEDTDGDGIPDAQDTWELAGDLVSSEYYLDTRTQWQTHPELPGGEDAQTRNSLISAPLRDGALSLLLKQQWFGVETSWWGIHAFKPRDLTPAVSKLLDSDSSSLWSATNATLSFGSDITVNPSAVNCEVKLDIGSMTVEPWMYPHLAKRIAVDWVATNVVSLSVYLESVDGSSRALLGTSTGTYDKPTTVGDTKYAGSWKQDHGAGYILDEGADSLVSGMSSVAMADTELVQAFSLLYGQQAKYLVFVIEVASAAADMTLKYPRFYAPTSAPYVYQENGHQNNVVWADGPGVRFGSWRWWDYAGNSELMSPENDVPGTRFSDGHKSSVLDLLRWENLFIQAKAYDTDITTNIAALYDSTEGQTKGKAAYDTIAFQIKSNSKLYGVMVNTWAEVPPLAVLPLRARDSDLAATGSFAQESWSFVQEPRRYVAAHTQLDVVNPADSSVWTSASGSMPASWKVSEHSHVLTNSEGNFDYKFGSKKVAIARPWHGAFSVPRKNWDGDGAQVGISADVHPNGLHVVVWVNDSGNVVCTIEDNALNELSETDLGFAADWVHVKVDRHSKALRIRLYTQESGSVYVRESIDGVTFGSGTLIAMGQKPTADISRNGIEYVYWLDGAAIKGARYDRAGNLIETAFTVVASGVDDDGISVTAGPTSAGVQRLVLRYIASGVRTTKTSTDGITFS